MPKRIEDFAKSMRKRPTPAEKRFKTILAGCCAIRDCLFENQKTFWNNSQGKGYIVDFYVPDYQLVIEIDGPYHNAPEQAEADKLRDAWFISSGKRVVRISNAQTHDKGYCECLLFPLMQIKRRAIRQRKRRIIKLVKDANGITHCPPYTEKDAKRDNYKFWRKSGGRTRRRKLTMVNTNRQG